MKSLLFSFLTFALLFGGKSKQEGRILSHQDKHLVDAYELSNLDYRIYESWMLNIFGVQSDAYKKCLPDTTVWRNATGGEAFVKNYYRHPAYDNYPVVGLSYEQATEYAKWRSDRVAERILTKKNILKKQSESAKNDAYFDKYLSVLGTIKEVALPRYRLLTPEEWSFYAKADAPSEYGIDENNNKIKVARKKGDHLFNYQVNEGMNTLLSPVYAYFPNNFKLYNMIGNAAEMTATKGVSKGGSFSHSIEACKITNNISYEKPQNWLGVRYIAVLEK